MTDPAGSSPDSVSPPDNAVALPDSDVSLSGNAVSPPGEVAARRRLTPSGDDRLAFSFTEDCWVEVQSASGERLYSDLSRAGSELDLVGDGPFRILLGYAPGAELSFNGEPVPLGPHTRNNVATLVLGQ
jgi:cytoskeleton protein RodZ